MIVRILGGEGQFQVGDEATAELTALDKTLDSSIEANDEGPSGRASTRPCGWCANRGRGCRTRSS